MKYNRIYEILNNDLNDLLSLNTFYDAKSVNSDQVRYYINICQYLINRLTTLDNEKEFNPFYEKEAEAIAIVFYSLHQEIRKLF